MSPAIGSVIEGTFRAQELIPKFLEVLKECNSPLWIEWTTPGAADFINVPKNPEDSWWASSEAVQVIQELIDALDDVAPEKCYFGAHFGNNSDFGFWPL